MADMGVYLAFDVDYISMIPTGGELVACRHSVKVDDEDLAGAYELIRKLYQEVRIERDNLKQENAKLREQIYWLKKGDVLHVLTDQELADHQKHEREMHASIAALMDENARLRSCLSDDAENAQQIMGENLKMRELCTDMHVWMGRALYENSARKYEYESITDRMDDLGVPHD